MANFLKNKRNICVFDVLFGYCVANDTQVLI